MVKLTKEEKKQLLIQTAIVLFSQNGLQKTTIAHITKKANIGKSTFYEYFKNKDELVISWFLYMEKEWAKMIQTIESIPNPKDKLKTFILLSCSKEYTTKEFLMMFMELWKLAFNDKNQEAIDLLKITYENFINIFESYLQDGIDKKIFIMHDTKKTASGLVSMIDGLWVQFMLFEDLKALEENGQNMLKLVLKGIAYE